MPREILDQQIVKLEDEILILGSMVEKAGQDSVDSLIHCNKVKAKKIVEDDQLINGKRYALENAILIAIATQQPMAHDLRLLAAMLEIINELERIGDYAKGIAKITLRRGEVDFPYPQQEFQKMVKQDISMLHRALDAFIKEDYKAAVEIPKEDDIVDGLYNKSFRMLVDTMVKDPAIIDHASLLLWVAHNLERFGDRVTNICERTVFTATGELMEMDSSEGGNPDEDE
jgi:phosphate transport system protein